MRSGMVKRPSARPLTRRGRQAAGSPLCFSRVTAAEERRSDLRIGWRAAGDRAELLLGTCHDFDTGPLLFHRRCLSSGHRPFPNRLAVAADAAAAAWLIERCSVDAL